MKESTQSQVSGFHFADRRQLYSFIALFIKSSSRLFLLSVAKVCNNIALFMVLTNELLDRKIYKLSQFIPFINDMGFLAILR